MYDDQHQQQQPKAPPPSAFLPPPPLMASSSGYTQQQQQQQGYSNANYQRQSSNGVSGTAGAGTAPSPLMQQQQQQQQQRQGGPAETMAPSYSSIQQQQQPSVATNPSNSNPTNTVGYNSNTSASSYSYPSSSSSYSAAQSQQFPSPYLPTPGTSSSGGGDGTLKSRNVTSSSSNSNSSGGYMLSNNMGMGNTNTTSTPSSSSSGTTIGVPIEGARKLSSSTTSTTNNNTSTITNNNSSIALLLLPPLLFLFLYEMSSSLPLLVLLCIALIVYSFDLANVGTTTNNANNDGYGSTTTTTSNNNNGGRGFYTLCSIWFSWILLCVIVGYDVIFLSEAVVDGNNNGNDAAYYYGADVEESGEDGGDTIASTTSSLSSSGISNLGFGLALLLIPKLSLSILLLFNLATWTTLQFNWLPIQMPMVAIFLERILHSTLPPVSAAMMSYGLFTASSWGVYNISLGVDSMAMVLPHLFAFHLMVGILLVGAAPSMIAGGNSGSEEQLLQKGNKKEDNKGATTTKSHVCAIYPREGRHLSYLLVFLPSIIHIISFRQRIAYYYASWDDLFDLILIATVPYTLHYLLASNGVLDERWRRSLPWVLQVGTSPAEGGERTLRGALVPMTISLFACMAFQHRYLVSLCARASYVINGHDGIISSTMATTFLTLGTVLAYATVWFFGRKNASGDAFLLGEYHEDFFQVLLASSSVCYGLSCSPKWTFLPVPVLFAESLALWAITKQLRYAILTAFVFFTVGTICVAYRLTFLNQVVEILPGKTIVLKKFADFSMYTSLWLIVLVGLVCRAPGGYAVEKMKKYDVTGICLAIYGVMLVVLEFALLRQPMPLYSRDNYEVGRVAVYSPGVAYFTGFLVIVITWHLKGQKLTKEGSVIVSTSIMVGKMLAVVIESSLVDTKYDSLGYLFLRWVVASLLLITISAPYLLKPIHVKMQGTRWKKRRDPSAKPTNMPNNASMTVVLSCAIFLPLVIISSVRLVVEPLVGLLTGQNNSSVAYSSSSPNLSEVIGYSASLWGISVLSMINHFLPDGGADVWRRVSALTFIMGLFVSFSAPAFPGASSSSWDASNAFQSVSSLDTENDVATGGWGLVSAFLAILLAMSGPLELREIRDATGRRDTRQLLRLMIFGMMFGCGLSWFITMQSMSKDIFIPIFVTTFACMAMSTLGTVAAVMGYFLDAREFVEAEQIANVWAGVAFPVFFVISSISLSAHCVPFGIGGWASTYLSVCGLLAGAFCVLVRLREEKTSTTRGYGNMSCVISWLCAIIVVYGRYGVAGVGVVGTTSVAGIPASVLGTVLCSPILILLEGEGATGGRKKYQISSSSSKSKKKGLVLSTLTGSNWFAPLLVGTVLVFLVSSFYAVFLRGCGLSKFSLLFGTGDVITSQEDVFSHVYGSSRRTTGIGALDDVANMAKKSIVHTKTMVAAAKLSASGIWTSSNVLGPVMHILGLVAVLPSLNYLVMHSWSGPAPSSVKVRLALPLNLLAMFVGRGIPSLVAAATIGLVGGFMQLTFV